MVPASSLQPHAPPSGSPLPAPAAVPTGLAVLLSSGLPLALVLGWAFAAVGEPSTLSDSSWPEPSVGGWPLLGLISVGVLSPGIPPISLGFVSKTGDLTYRAELRFV